MSNFININIKLYKSKRVNVRMSKKGKKCRIKNHVVGRVSHKAYQEPTRVQKK